MLEVILVVALLGITVPIVTIIISNSFKESESISKKIEIQTSVSALMNKFEEIIKEATVPISDNDLKNNEITIYKTDGGEVNFLFVPLETKVIYKEKDIDGNIVNTQNYNNINYINFKLKSNGFGALIEVAGGEGSSRYELSNIYYSRNTVSSTDLADNGKYVLKTVVGCLDIKEIA